ATLDKGPKFAMKPRLPPPEKLSMVRSSADKVLSQDRDRCIADGVDVLCQTAGLRSKIPKLTSIVDHFRINHLKLLTSGKEGGFVVVPQELYWEKAEHAVLKNFKQVKPGYLNMLK
ncbi:hypothetical protein HPB47_025212, partial [Ixodes persulcatus]